MISPEDPSTASLDPHPASGDDFMEQVHRARKRKRQLIIGAGVVGVVIIIGIAVVVVNFAWTGKNAIDAANKTMSHVSAGDVEATRESLAPECRDQSTEDFQLIIDFVNGGSYNLTNFRVNSAIGGDTNRVVYGTVEPEEGVSFNLQISMVVYQGDWTPCGIFIG